MTLPVYMPLIDGVQIPCQVLTGLLTQMQDVYLRPITRPGRAGCRLGEAGCRNDLLAVAGGLQKQGAACMVDRDVVLADKEALRDALEALSWNPEMGAVHVMYKPGLTDQHFDIGCVVFRVEAVQALTFPSGETCLCGAFAEHLKLTGWKQCYLAGVRGYEYTD